MQRNALELPCPGKLSLNLPCQVMSCVMPWPMPLPCRVRVARCLCPALGEPCPLSRPALLPAMKLPWHHPQQRRMPSLSPAQPSTASEYALPCPALPCPTIALPYRLPLRDCPSRYPMHLGCHLSYHLFSWPWKYRIRAALCEDPVANTFEMRLRCSWSMCSRRFLPTRQSWIILNFLCRFQHIMTVTASSPTYPLIIHLLFGHTVPLKSPPIEI